MLTRSSVANIALSRISILSRVETKDSVSKSFHYVQNRHIYGERAYCCVDQVSRSSRFRRLVASAAGMSAAPFRPADAQVPRVLTIAGSDSGGGAGVQADIKTCDALGIYSSSAITALTAQNTHGVQAVCPLDPAFLRLQIDSCLSDIGADAVKTGMLSSADLVEVVADSVKKYNVKNLVVDPVLVSTSGHSLASEGVCEAIGKHLLPLAAVITPNKSEAEALLGDGRTITTVEEMEKAARDLHAKGAACVVITGGHMAGLKDHGQGATDGKEIVDVLFDGGRTVLLRGPKLEAANSHGTGCTFASAIAAHLAKGYGVRTAVQLARQYVQGALEASSGLLVGGGMQRPMNHGYQTHNWAEDSWWAWVRDLKRELNYLRVYAVTDPGCNQRQGRSMTEAVKAAVDGGATIVQLREKRPDNSSSDGLVFIKAAREALEVCRPRGVPLVINDRVDVCLAVGADGVHIGQDDIPAAMVRQLIGPNKILGVSAKTPEEIQAAFEAGADYVGCGAVYPTATKDNSVHLGLEKLTKRINTRTWGWPTRGALFRQERLSRYQHERRITSGLILSLQLCATSPVPVVAIGGIKPGNGTIEPCMKAGAVGIAVVSGIFDADPKEACQRITEEIAGALGIK